MPEPITRRKMFGWIAVAFGTPLLCEAGAVSLEDLSKPSLEQQHAILKNAMAGRQNEDLFEHVVVNGTVWGLRWYGWFEQADSLLVMGQYLASRYDLFLPNGLSRTSGSKCCAVKQVQALEGASWSHLFAKRQACRKRLIHFLEQNT